MLGEPFTKAGSVGAVRDVQIRYDQVKVLFSSRARASVMSLAVFHAMIAAAQNGPEASRTESS